MRGPTDLRIARVLRGEDRRTLADEADLAAWVGQMRTVWSGVHLTADEAVWVEAWRGLL